MFESRTASVLAVVAVALAAVWFVTGLEVQVDRLTAAVNAVTSGAESSQAMLDLYNDLWWWLELFNRVAAMALFVILFGGLPLALAVLAGERRLSKAFHRGWVRSAAATVCHGGFMFQVCTVGCSFSMLALLSLSVPMFGWREFLLLLSLTSYWIATLVAGCLALSAWRRLLAATDSARPYLFTREAI